MSNDGARGPLIEHGTANVFADIGLPDAEERLAKALLARAIKQIITHRGWTQARAAQQVGLAASDMSDVVRGKLARFSLDRLESLILDLDMDIHLKVTPKRAEAHRGHISVELVTS
jgi:predicted XRE-type DNA-binding protein